MCGLFHTLKALGQRWLRHHTTLDHSFQAAFNSAGIILQGGGFLQTSIRLFSRNHRDVGSGLASIDDFTIHTLF